MVPGSAAASARPEFQGGDRIVKIDGQPVANYRDLRAQLALHPDKTLAVAVQRRVGEAGETSAAAARTQEITIQVPPSPVRDLGIVMEMGPITAVQEDSAAQAAGLQPQDMILRIDGRPPEDPTFLPEWFRRRGAESPKVTLSVQREAAQKVLEIPVQLRPADHYEVPELEGNPVAVASLGIAVQVRNRIQRVLGGSPADRAGLRPGDVVVAAKVLAPDVPSVPSAERKALRELEKKEIEISERKPNWPLFFLGIVQELPAGSRVELRLEDDRTVTLEPQPRKDWFRPDRGFVLKPESLIRTARSLGEAAVLGARETGDSLTMVFRTLEKLGTGQVSPKAPGRTRRDHRVGRACRISRHLEVPDLPYPAQRQSGADQLPADPHPRWRPHGLPRL